jgi:hypothetical protein
MASHSLVFHSELITKINFHNFYLFIYLLIYLLTYLSIYLFIYMYLPVFIYFFCFTKHLCINCRFLRICDADGSRAESLYHSERRKCCGNVCWLPFSYWQNRCRVLAGTVFFFIIIF